MEHIFVMIKNKQTKKLRVSLCVQNIWFLYIIKIVQYQENTYTEFIFPYQIHLAFIFQVVFVTLVNVSFQPIDTDGSGTSASHEPNWFILKHGQRQQAIPGVLIETNVPRSHLTSSSLAMRLALFHSSASMNASTASLMRSRLRYSSAACVRMSLVFVFLFFYWPGTWQIRR